MFYIYIILLINNTYLILSSEDRINQIHNTPNYKDIIEIIKSYDKYDFDKIVNQYITEFGIDKVKNATYNNITEDDKQIIEYIDNITVTDIEKEIQKLTMLKQKIIRLKTIINSTKLNQVEEYGFGKFISDYTKYQRFTKLSEENKDILSQMTNIRKIHQNIQTLPAELSSLYTYFIDINNFTNQINKITTIREIILEISSSYHNYINYQINKKQLPENYIRDTDVILQLYSSMYFNKKMQSHLTNFIKKNASEEELITKLTYEYSKLI